MAEIELKVRRCWIDFDVCEKFDLGWSEYILVDIIHSLSQHGFDKHQGWCFASKSYLAKKMRISKRGVIKILDRLEEKGLVSQDPANNKHLKATQKWIYATVLKKETGENESVNKVHPIGELSSPQSVNKVHPIGELSSPSPTPPNKDDVVKDVKHRAITSSLGQNGSKQPISELDFSKVAEAVFKSCPFAKKNISIENLTNHLLKMYSRVDWICYHLNRLRDWYDRNEEFRTQETNRGQWSITITRWFLKQKQIDQQKGGFKKMLSQI